MVMVKPARTVLLSIGLLLLTAPSAWAHAQLVVSTPADRSALDRAPSSVRLEFDDHVQIGSDIEVHQNGGDSVLAGDPTLAERGRVLVLPLKRGLANGDYSVRWQIISDDGHPLSGVLAFSVGTGVPPAGVDLSAGSNAPPRADLIARWLLLLGILATAGAAVFRELVWRPALERAELSDEARAELGRRERLRTSLLLAGGFYLLVVGASIAVLHIPSNSATRFGHTMEFAIAFAGAGVITAIVVAATAASGRGASASRLFIAVPGLALLPSLGGHALEGSYVPLKVLSDMTHMVASSIWFGGLLELALVVPLVAAVVTPAVRAPLYAELARRFSLVALVSVIVLVGSGVVRALFAFGSVDELWSTAYGATILIKTALLAVLIVLGALNRSRFVPALSDTAAGAPGALVRFARFRKNMVSEIAVLVALAAAVALLTDLPPPS
ncbi:MAG: copper transport protein [Gaiellales bacterium]|nr:copper transport protein [Gaiellales bacterium]